MPGPSSRLVIIGLTNGPGFYPNPCLRSQVRWIKNHHVRAAVYSMTTYPTRRQLAKFGATGPHAHKHLYGRLWNTGHAQAQFNLDTMKAARLRSPFIWVDVEPYTVSPWTRHRTNNAAVIRGVVAGYQRGGHRVGFYSTQSLWAQIVGKLRYGYPEWRTAGQTSMVSALHKCSHAPIQAVVPSSRSGGPVAANTT